MPNHELSAGQEFLFENDLIKRRSPQRAKALACLACRWAKSEENNTPPRTYGYEIVRCTGFKSGALHPILKHLEAVGVVQAEYENPDELEAVRPRRKYLTPVQTELGEEFKELIEAPEQCLLEQHTPDV